MKKIIPINEYLILKKINIKKKTNIIMPKGINISKNIGKVVFLPKNDKLNKLIKINSLIIFLEYSSNKIKIFNNKYIVVKYKNIIGILK